MTFIEFTTDFLNNLISETSQELDRLNKFNGLATPKKRLKALQLYIEAKYLDGSSISNEDFDGFLKANAMNKKAFISNFVEHECYKPFKKQAAEQFEELVGQIEKVHAINKKDLLEKFGATGNEKAFQFIVDCFKLEELDYDFKPFKDKYLETLYSNDSLKINDYVTTFFRFFIDGDADNNKEYDPEKYYGCIPVSEKRIVAYCKQESIPQEYIDKLLAIAKCSNRFINKDGYLSLKKQYLYNSQSYAAAILYENKKPLHIEQLHDRINQLAKQYPELVKKYTLQSISTHMNRKPINCLTGGQGEWGLEIWKKDKRDVSTVIRDFVADTFAKTQEPVHIDQIVGHVLSIGFSYDKKSIKTYVTKAGCKGTGKNTYYPAESDFTAVDRYWSNKSYILQREAAEFILENGPSSRTDIINHITEKFHSVNKMTLEKALFEYTELFLKEGKLKNQRIKLSDKITSKKAIKLAFPEPTKQGPEYLVEIKCKMVEYLKTQGSALQTYLVDRFKEDVPKDLKEKGGPIRKLLSDKNVFIKTKIGDKQTRVTLNPLYLEKMQHEAPTIKVLSSPAVEKKFSWEALKESVIRQMAEKEYDETLPKYVDNLFLIVKGGYENFLPNSNFKGLIMQLFKYETAETSQEERKSLRKDMLLMMEAYFDEFYRLQYGKNLKELVVEKGLKARVDYLRVYDILPDKYKKQLDKYEWTVYCATNNVWYQRNFVAAHPEAFDTQKDIQSIKDIHDCLVVMLHLAKQLTKK